MQLFFLYHHLSQHIHAPVVSVRNTSNETDWFTPADCRCVQSDPNCATAECMTVDLFSDILPN